MPLIIPGFSVGIGADADPLLKELRRVGDELEKTRRKTEQSAAQMSKGMATVTAGASALRTALATVGVGFGVAAISGFISSTFRAADALKGAADAAGISAEALQRWRFAAEQSGSDAGTMDIAIRTLNERLGDFARTGTGPAALALKELGLAAKVQSGELSGTTATMDAAITALAELDDSSRQSSLSTDLFGKAAGPQLAGMLNEGVEGIRRLREETAVLTDEQVARADEIGDRWAKMTSQLTTNLQSATLFVTDWVTRGAEANNLVADAYDQMATDIIADIRSTFPVLDELVTKTAQIPALITNALGLTFASIEDARQALAEVTVKRGALAEQAISYGEAPESMLAVQEADKRIASINKQIAAMEALTQAHKPLEVEIHKAAEASRTLLPSLKPLADAYGENAKGARTFAAAQKDLTETLTFDVEGDRRLKQLQSIHANEKRIADERELTIRNASAPAEALRDTESLTAEMEGVWQGLGQSIQNTFADTYEDIFTGGLTSFQDFASSIKDIFIRLAAEVAAVMTAKAMFGGLSGAGAQLGGLFGQPTGGGAASFGQGQMTPGGVMIPAVAPAGGFQGWWGSGFSQAPTGGAALGGGLAGLTGGLAFGGMAGKAAGGGVGGGLAGAGAGALSGAGMGAMAGPWGAAIGAGIGAIAGGLMGGLSGGSSGARKATIGGGPLGGTGSGQAAQFGAAIDQQLQQALTMTQETVVNAALATSKAITVEFNKKKGLSEGDKQRIAAARFGPAAEALGINAAAVTRGTAEQQQSQFQEALTTKNAIDDLRQSLTPFAAQWQDLGDKFAELGANAAKYGISLDGVAEAQARANAELARQQRLTHNSVAAMVGAMNPFERALSDLQTQMEQASAEAQALGVYTGNLAKIHAEAAQQIVRAYQLQYYSAAEAVGAINPFERALHDLNVQMEAAGHEANKLGISTARLGEMHQRAANEIHRAYAAQWHAAAEAVGAIRPLDRALADLGVQMQQVEANAQLMGISTRNLGAMHARAAEVIVQNWRLGMHEIMQSVGVITPLERALGDLDAQMRILRTQADANGISTARLTQLHVEAAQAIMRQHQAQMDAMALSITNPFEQLLEPLRSLGIELDRSLMDPLEQFNASAQNFRDVARAAMGGSTTAIAQLDEAAKGFIDTATTVNASAGRAAATREVQAVLGPLQAQVAAAQQQAGRGVEGAIWGANQRVVDTLGELVTVGRQQIEEMRRLQRQLS